MLGRKRNCTSGQEKFGLTHCCPVGLMEGVSVHWGDAGAHILCDAVCQRTRKSFEKSALFLLRDLQAECVKQILGSISTKTPVAARTSSEGRSEVSCPLSYYKSTWVGWAYFLCFKVEGREGATHASRGSRIGPQTFFLLSSQWGKPFTFASASSPMLIQIEILFIFLKRGGQL